MSPQPSDRSFWNKVSSKGPQPDSPGPCYKQVGKSFYIYAPPTTGNVLTRAYDRAVWKYRTRKLEKQAGSRPVDPWGPMGWDSMGRGELQVRRFPRSYTELFELFDQSAVWRACVLTLIGEALRPNLEWEKECVAYCPKCLIRYDRMDDDDTCDSCGTALEEPDEDEYQEADRWFRKGVNSNKQDIKDVLAVIGIDSLIVDEGYEILSKKYTHHKGIIIEEDTEVLEVVRADPRSITPIQKDDGTMGGRYWTCLDHRDPYDARGQVIVEHSTTSDKAPNCPRCGSLMHDVHFVNTIDSDVGKGGGYIYRYYIEGEVIWKKNFYPGLFYGKPQGITLYHILNTLIEKEIFTHEEFYRREIPNSFLAVPTDDPQGARSAINQMKIEKKNNPHYVAVIPYRPAPGSSGSGVAFINAMPGQTMGDWLALRDAYRKEVMGFYGTMPIFMADLSTGGGLNNEGLQMTVGNREAQAQQTYFQQFVDAITKAFGIRWWRYKLQPTEERDKKSVIERMLLNLSAIQQCKSMKMDVEITDYKELTFIPKGEPEEIVQQAQQWPGDEIQNPDAAMDVPNVNVTPGKKPQSGRNPNPRPPRQPTPAGGRGNQRFGGEPSSMRRAVKALASEDYDVWLNGVYRTQYNGIAKAPSAMFGQHQLFSDEVLDKLLSLPNLLWRQYDGVSRADSDKIGDMILERVRGHESLDAKAMIRAIRDIDSNIDEVQAENIARTELSNIVSKGRDLQWKEDDPNGDAFNYKLVGPGDARCCWAHDQIKERQGKGLPMAQLKALIAEVFAEAQGRGEFQGLELRNDFGIHPQQRHVPVRAVVW